MNKSELIDCVASAADMSKADVSRAINGVIATVTQALKSGDRVTIVGFGTFLVRHRDARAGRNSRTGETIQINASNVPAFKAGKALKDAVGGAGDAGPKKSELIDAVGSAADLSKADSSRAVDGVIASDTEALKSGDQVTIVGFGTFLVRHRDARAGRNPRTGETIQIKASNVPAFKAGKALKDAVGGAVNKPNRAFMNIFFATDRKQYESAKNKDRFSKERGELLYGSVIVSIPIDHHETGKLESPSIWKLQFREDPDKHIVMLDVTTFDKSPFYEVIAERVNSSVKKSAFIFVHGYNNTFEGAAKRTAQMSYDLAFDGAPVFYSWPSHGSSSKYPGDEANIEWAQSNIEEFLKDFSEKSEAENIYLIAHSMGNRALTRAYVSVVNENPELKSRITEIILAAPDIDADVFIRDIAPAMVSAGNPITLYASSKDIPLKLSKGFHGGHPRAGESGEKLLILPGIESIESANVDTGFLEHSYFADKRTVIDDIFYILNEGLRAHRRAGLNEVTSPSGVYWEFKK